MDITLMVNQIHLMEMSIQVTAQMFWVTSNYFDLKKKKVLIVVEIIWMINIPDSHLGKQAMMSLHGAMFYYKESLITKWVLVQLPFIHQ